MADQPQTTPKTVAEAIVEEGARLGIIHVPSEDELRAMKTTETPRLFVAWARTFLEAALDPASDQCKAGISILSKTLNEVYEEGRRAGRKEFAYVE